MDLSSQAITAAVPAATRRLAVVQSAVTVGPLVFLGVVLGLQIAGPTEPILLEPSVLDILSLVHGVLALSTVPLSVFVLPGLLQSPNRFEPCAALARTDEAAAIRCLFGVLMRERMVPIALLEGTAIFGIVVCLLAVLAGTATEHPIYWLNAATTAVLLLISLATFPTAARVADMVERLTGR